MASPMPIRFADGTSRCADCKGFGLVRAKGARAGEHYKTLNGAQTAYVNGNARDCRLCEGSGLRGAFTARDAIVSWGVDRAGVIQDKLDTGIRSVVVGHEDGSYLLKARLPHVPDFTPAPF